MSQVTDTESPSVRHSRVYKFVITPYCLEIVNGEIVAEHRMKDLVHFTGNELSLKDLQIKLEGAADGLFSQKPNSE